ncbi:hypothetical protein [Moritella sp. Urea-trap-13]|uniref:baseplate complex protein n=1 Tax=Moritella sp. Urea-trap-13 TaxID=2058327 RepID=UPI000C346B59|nr:hypothetical protein [Moritella sp. Urea-trap-13]PKH06654.1 hypothetical protein CXF93_12210 [Moritella sp. Urea-trap-13]
MTQIALDGELLTLKSSRINLSMDIKDADMSGQTANTDSAEQGIKGKEMAVIGLVSFKNPEILNRLLLLAQQTQDGKRKIYRISNELAKAMKIRQVRFTGRVKSDEQENLMAWRVSFTLREYLSVPEVKAQRDAENQPQGKTETTENTAKVTPKAHPAAVSDSQAQTPEVTGFAKTLKSIDTWLA